MKINNMDVDDSLIDSLIDAVRTKKTLVNIDKQFIKTHLVKFLSNHLNYIPKLTNTKSKEFVSTIKYVRSQSHNIYEIFQTTNISKREKLLNEMKTLDTNSVVPLLETHISTKERLPYYEETYKEIFQRIGFPKGKISILDIGCGLNPISIPYLEINTKKLTYYASEMSADDLTIINHFFSKFHILGETFSCNLTKDYEKLKKYPVFVCFAFKVFDVLESQEVHIGYEILSSINADYLIASFPLQNIKQMSMERSKVNYFERFLNKTSRTFETFSTENELFYIVSLKTPLDKK
jgi:2-polyprenyl-3-methyl-5-hydroxy-6-metoxy-1,4-benzoquinol methylase